MPRKRKSYDFPNMYEPKKLAFTYRITGEDYDLLEELAEETGWNKNQILDLGLTLAAEKLRKRKFG